MSWHPCLKQQTRCVIRLSDGRHVEGVNSCNVGGATECPRVVAGCGTGTGYDVCGPPVHAEAAAAAKVPVGNRGGVAQLYGHTWICKDCQDALIAKGVRVFEVVA